MSAKHSQTVHVEIEGAEIAVDVTYTYTKGSPAVMYQRNGDPGWPAEPPELEILSMKVDGLDAPHWFQKAIEESDRVRDFLFEHHEEPEREYMGRDYPCAT